MTRGPRGSPGLGTGAEDGGWDFRAPGVNGGWRRTRPARRPFSERGPGAESTSLTWSVGDGGSQPHPSSGARTSGPEARSCPSTLPG